MMTKTDQIKLNVDVPVSEMRTPVKVCFVMDCTASMGPWMTAAKDHIQELIYDARQQHPNARFEVAFVGYRDYGSSQQHIPFDFQEPEELVRRLRPIQAKEGDDEAEDVAWGLFHASRLSWEGANVRLVYHIADAPAHGQVFHRGDVTDRFLEGDPKFLDPRQMIREWSQQGYTYTFLRITHLTDTMIDQFHTAWIGSGSFRLLDLSLRGPHGFADAIRESMNETVTQYTASQDPTEE